MQDRLTVDALTIDVVEVVGSVLLDLIDVSRSGPVHLVGVVRMGVGEGERVKAQKGFPR